MTVKDGARENIGVRLLPGTIRELDAAAERLGKSRAFVIEALAALYARTLSAQTPIPLGMLPADSRQRKRHRIK